MEIAVQNARSRWLQELPKLAEYKALLRVQEQEWAEQQELAVTQRVSAALFCPYPPPSTLECIPAAGIEPSHCTLSLSRWNRLYLTGGEGRVSLSTLNLSSSERWLQLEINPILLQTVWLRLSIGLLLVIISYV